MSKLTDDVATQSKVGSCLVHLLEFLSPHGNQVDYNSARALWEDPEVQAWVKEMGPLLPVTREPIEFNN